MTARRRAIFTRAVVCLLAAIAAGGAVASAARADGDPGSDVLVFQNLFVGSDAGVSVAQQAQLGGLLTDAARAGFPIRVAIIADRFDLGAVTALWQKPQSYARFLGLELSLSYKQRLLVVMPDGFGFNWPGHGSAVAYRVLAKIPVGAGGSGLLNAAESGVRSLAAASGARISAPSAAALGGAVPSPKATAPSVEPAGRGKDLRVALVTAILGALAAVILGVRLRPAEVPKRSPSRSATAVATPTASRPPAKLRPRLRRRDRIVDRRADRVRRIWPDVKCGARDQSRA